MLMSYLVMADVAKRKLARILEDEFNRHLKEHIEQFSLKVEAPTMKNQCRVLSASTRSGGVILIPNGFQQAQFKDYIWK